MALAKELHSEGSCGEQVVEKESESNDSQQQQTTAPINAAYSRSEDDKGVAFNSVRERSDSIDSGELDIIDSPSNSSDASCTSIRSLNSNQSLGRGEVRKNIGEADTVDDTVDDIEVDEDEILSEIKETNSLDDSSSIDTNEDDNFATKAIAADQKREERKKRIAEMDQHEEFRRRAMAKRKEQSDRGLPTEIELKKEARNHGDLDSGDDDEIAMIDNLLSTVYSEDDIEPSHYATAAKKSKKKKNKKNSKRKDRKLKSDKNNASDSTGGSWWKLSFKAEIDDSSNTGTARKRKNSKANFAAEASDSYRSIGSKDFGNGDFYMPKIIRNGRRVTSAVDPPGSLRSRDSACFEDSSHVAPSGMEEMVTATPTKQNRKFEGSYSLRSIVEREDCEEMKDSGRVGTSRMVERSNTTMERQDHSAQAEHAVPPAELVESTIDNDDINGYKRNSAYGGAIGLNDMIAQAAAKRQERLALNKSPKLPFQSPVSHKGSLSSRLQNKEAVLAPLSPLECDDVSISVSELGASPNIDNESNEGSKNSGYGATIGMNEMIAAAAAKRRERLLSGSSPKLPFQSPVAEKGSLSSRLRKKDFTSPLSPPITEHGETSALGTVELSSSANTAGVEVNDRNREMSIADLAADAAAKRSERVKENNMKPKSFKKFPPVALNEEKRREDKENHRKIFVPVAGEAATYGRLVRLEEHVVEAQGGVNHHPGDRFNTWSGPKLRTDDQRSNAMRAIQEAAAVGRIKRLTPEIVTNGSDDVSDDHFDIENQIDEHGNKILRTNFLLDRHVKDILQSKKNRMFTDSDAVGDRDEKIAGYKDFDDVKLPTETLPTFNRVVGNRLNNKSFSSCADLAVMAMQMSERNLQPKLNDDEDDDAPQITMKRLRVIESISSAVAESACKRDARLQQPRAVLKVTRKCMCPYCKDPNPYQTHKYKRLMYPALFNDNVDQSNYCQEVGETIGTVSDAAKANKKSSYTISPGGRKKKIIRIVRRKKRRPQGLQPSTTVMRSSEKNPVIEGASLTPEELDRLTKHLQDQGTQGMTTKELVQIANVLRDKASTAVDVSSVKKSEETHDASNQISSSQGQQESTNDLSTDKLLQTAAELNATGLTTEEMLQLESKLLVSPHHDDQDADLDADQAKGTIDEIRKSDVFGEADREANVVFTASLPFIDITGDCSSIPTASTQEVTIDTPTKCPPPDTNTRKKRESGTKNRRSKAKKKERTKSPVLPKSPSLRKPRKMISAPPGLSSSKKEYLSPQGQQKKKSARRRPKETTQSPIQIDTSNLPAPPSGTGEAPRKKTLRSRLKNLARSSSPRRRNDSMSLSEHGSQHDQNKTPRLIRRGARRSHSLHARNESLPTSDHGSRNDEGRTSESDRRGGRRSNSLNGRNYSLPLDDHDNQDDKDELDISQSFSGSLVKESLEALLPRSRKRNISKQQTSTSNKHSGDEDEKQNWTPAIRAPRRTKSLPIGQEQDLDQKISKPHTFRSLPLETIDSPSRVAPSRTLSLQDPLRFSNDDADTPRIRGLSPKADEGPLKLSKNSFDKSPSGSPKQPFQSPHSQKRSLSARLPKRQPPSPQIKVNPQVRPIPPTRKNSLSKPIPPIPSFITISNETPEECVDSNSNSNSTDPTSLETPESSESSHLMQKRRVLAKKPQKTKSLDGKRPKPRKCRSLDGQRISEMTTKSRSKPKKGRKADHAEPEKMYRDNVKESRPDPPSSHRQGLRQNLKRSRSLDRLALTKLGGREKGDGKDRSIERRKDKSLERKKDRSVERRKDKSLERKKDRSVERRKDRSLERKKDRSVERRKDRSRERKQDRSVERRKDRSLERKKNNSKPKRWLKGQPKTQ